MATKTTSPNVGADVFKMFGGMNMPAFDKMFGGMNLPALDVDAMLSAQRRNFETFAQVNQIALDGFQALAKRQGELLTKGFNSYGKASKAVLESRSPAETAAKQAAAVNDGITAALDNAREISEMVAGTAGRALETFGKRFAEGLDEVGTLVKENGAAR